MVSKTRIKEASPQRRPDILIRLVGNGVEPAAVPMRSLAKLFEAVQRLVDQREDDTDDSDLQESDLESGASVDPVDPTLRLVNVTSGSAVYGIASPSKKATIAVLSLMALGLKAPDAAEWTASTLRSIEQMSEVARSIGCDVEIRKPRSGTDYGTLIAQVKGSTYGEIERQAFIRGDTTVIGTLQRVGGAMKLSCGLYVPGRTRMLICEVAGAELARQMAQHLYQTIVVRGEATWYRRNWTLSTIRVTTFEPPKTVSLRDAGKLLREAGGSGWDGVDVRKAIAEIRGL